MSLRRRFSGNVSMWESQPKTNGKSYMKAELQSVNAIVSEKHLGEVVACRASGNKSAIEAAH
ncbi:hypothetical protein DD238_001835 [Peronospora effusa]|uniref:Uncharacterized protein n=1 Tax=Peronospora effusa TaxID=542832 RepID=A0A3M6VSE8_9STRA|nr:hypothetical protein DD238_001835 [Peronospora effusa]RQM11314.1 hypothetical protein DD237_000800 [Peronospora effusa]